MGPLTRTGKRATKLIILLTLFVCATYAQTLTNGGRCQVSSVPAQVRAEGLTERLGDILLQCSGTSSTVLTGNLTVSLPVAVTNRIDANNVATDPVLFIDYGSGFGPAGFNGLVSSQSIAFNGVSISVPASGSFTLKISNLRAAVHQAGLTNQQPLSASLSVSAPTFLQMDHSQVIVAYAVNGLYATLYSTGIACTGSPVPATLAVSSLFTAGTALASTRITEGFGSAFQPRAAGEDTGTRFLVNYTAFPANAHLYLPDLVAGSDASVPTSGGDLNLPRAAGQYVPRSGTLLLARVQGAASDGSGGTLVPLPTGSAPVTLDSVTEVPLANGSGYAVFEVVDANPIAIESAQFPTFIGLASITGSAVAQETISFAPVSNVAAASGSAPVPRFVSMAPGSDCTLVGDCGAGYFPSLTVDAAPVQLTAKSDGTVTSTAGYIPVRNSGGGQMNWTASVNYTNGSGWILLDVTSATNNASVRVFPQTKGLAPGTYQASVLINAGTAGTKTVPITLTVAPAPSVTPPNPTPSVSKVVNAATFNITPLVAGSLATILGSHLAGKNVSVTFDSKAAIVLYSDDSQINVQLPADLGGKSAAVVLVTADGVSSAPVTVTLGPAWPAIFNHGIRNQDNSENLPTGGAKPGTVLQIYGTGIPAGATVSVQIGTRRNLVPLYAGPAPTVPGVQQVNVAVPDDSASGNTTLVICATVGGQSYCSAESSLSVQ